MTLPDRFTQGGPVSAAHLNDLMDLAKGKISAAPPLSIENGPGGITIRWNGDSGGFPAIIKKVNWEDGIYDWIEAEFDEDEEIFIAKENGLEGKEDDDNYAVESSFFQFHPIGSVVHLKRSPVNGLYYFTVPTQIIEGLLKDDLTNDGAGEVDMNVYCYDEDGEWVDTDVIVELIDKGGRTAKEDTWAVAQWFGSYDDGEWRLMQVGCSPYEE